MTYQTEFPDYPAADMPAIPPQFIDVSWKNDTCPCFEWTAGGFRLWVDYKDKALREWPDTSRFILVPVNEDGEGGRDLFTTETWDDMLVLINEYLDDYKGS